MKLTKSNLRKLIKEEFDKVVAGDPSFEVDPPHGAIGAQWSGTPEKGIIELKDGTTITVYGGPDRASLEKVAAGLAAMGVKSIADSVNRGAPEKVLDFLITKHLAGNIVDIP